MDHVFATVRINDKQITSHFELDVEDGEYFLVMRPPDMAKKIVKERVQLDASKVRKGSIGPSNYILQGEHVLVSS
jgi:hypothetical protein